MGSMGNPKALPIQLRQFPSKGLEILPGFDPAPYRRRQRLRHVVARGLALLAPEADVEIRPVLLSLLATTVGLATRAVGLGQRPEDRPLRQCLHPS
jgi:hypothetical protein